MIIEKKVDPIRVICESRALKALVVLTQAEFCFVASSKDLNSNEKMVWFALANESASNAELSCILSYQHLAELVGQSVGSVYDAIQRLNRMGYISAFNEEEQDEVGYKLKLPLSGLLKLKKAHKIRDFNNREYIHALRCGNDPVLPNILKTYPINSHISPKPNENMSVRTAKRKSEKSRGSFCSTSPPKKQSQILKKTIPKFWQILKKIVKDMRVLFYACFIVLLFSGIEIYEHFAVGSIMFGDLISNLLYLTGFLVAVGIFYLQKRVRRKKVY